MTYSKSFQYVRLLLRSEIDLKRKIGINYKFLRVLVTQSLDARVCCWKKPPIDNSSDEGVKPDSMEGNIHIEDVAFSYPSRSGVQVSDEHPDVSK